MKVKKNPNLWDIMDPILRDKFKPLCIYIKKLEFFHQYIKDTLISKEIRKNNTQKE